MKLIVGLGNPGRKYKKTRHNIGFMVLDVLAERHKIDIDKNDFKGEFGRGDIKNEEVILFKPQTYMNLSGEAVQAIVHYFKIDVEDIIVIFDDMALPVGKIRLRLKGSSGGHNGMKDISNRLSNQEIKRIRVGIGQSQYESSDYVLAKPSKEERKQLDIAIETTANAIEDTLEHDFEFAMTKYN